jgi:hypothetical protein
MVFVVDDDSDVREGLKGLLVFREDKRQFPLYPQKNGVIGRRSCG